MKRPSARTCSDHCELHWIFVADLSDLSVQVMRPLACLPSSSKHPRSMATRPSKPPAGGSLRALGRTTRTSPHGRTSGTFPNPIPRHTKGVSALSSSFGLSADACISSPWRRGVLTDKVTLKYQLTTSR
jgi:hypothetical protein